MMENKAGTCIFVNYKYGVKGYKILYSVRRKKNYSHDMIFREFVNAPKHEDAQREGKLEKLEFDPDNGESN